MESFGPIGGRIGRVFVIDASSFIRLRKFVVIIRKGTPTIPTPWTHIVMRNSIPGTVNITASFAIFVVQRKDVFCRFYIIVGCELIKVFAESQNAVGISRFYFAGQRNDFIHILRSKSGCFSLQNRALV